MQSDAGADQGVNGGESVAPSGMPVPGVPPTIATESVAVSGSNSPSLAGTGQDELRAGSQNNQMGGVPGAPGGGMGGGGGFGGRGGGRPVGRSNTNQMHGTIYYSANDAALNAAPFSLTGAQSPNPAYLQQRFGGDVGGPLIIPHLYNGAKTFFFLHYNGTLGDTPYSYFSTVPTLPSAVVTSLHTLVNGQTVQIFNPATGQAFANNTIPQNLINPAAKGLLAYIPLPNLPGQVQNFQSITAAKTDSNDLNFRLNQALGARQQRWPRTLSRPAEQSDLRLPLSRIRPDTDQCLPQRRRNDHHPWLRCADWLCSQFRPAHQHVSRRVQPQHYPDQEPLRVQYQCHRPIGYQRSFTKSG